MFFLPLRITNRQGQPPFRVSWFEPLRNLLAEADSPARSEVIFVLAGRPERKVYGLQLFHEGFAPRLILSVGRFEVRRIEALGFNDLNLRERAARLAPEQRHFFLDIDGNSRRIVARGEAGGGTYAELLSLSRYLESEGVGSLLLVSTSIHLSRVRYFCRRIALFSRSQIRYVSVPETLSSFRRAGWWKRRDHWSYVLWECAKLGICLLLPPRNTR